MKHTILFADNERGIRQYCKSELEDGSLRVVLAEDGIEACDVLEHADVDLVVLDEHMPRCTGLDAARQIRQWHPHIPIVLFTADQDYERYKRPWVDATVIKSGDLSALRAAIDRLLHGGYSDAPQGGRPAVMAGMGVEAQRRDYR